jgi:hypothetical protein
MVQGIFDLRKIRLGKMDEVLVGIIKFGASPDPRTVDFLRESFRDSRGTVGGKFSQPSDTFLIDTEARIPVDVGPLDRIDWLDQAVDGRSAMATILQRARRCISEIAASKATGISSILQLKEGSLLSSRD